MDGTEDNQKTECRNSSEALIALFDGAASDVEQQLATAHLAQCPACAQMWREWQSLRLMEQRALEPAASGEMLPLAPVKVPRHLKAAILRKTVATPIWQRFWPRLLTGMAVPTFAVACWLLIVAAPWQQSLPEISTPQNPVPENRVTAVPEKSAPTLLNATSKSTPVKTAKPVAANENKTISPSPQTEAKPVSAAAVSKINHAARAATTTNKPAKSTFTPAPKPETRNPEPGTQIKPPQISMASLDRPRSRAVKPAAFKTAKPIVAIAPKPRATAPVLVAELPAQDMQNPTDVSSDPVLDYIAQNDVRPDDIRQAVENYRAALLDDGSNL
jgi:hypothetical protein